VEEDLRRVSTAEVIGILFTGVGILFAFFAWRTARRSVQVSEEQLRLAREQTAMRPKLGVSMRDTPFTWGPGRVEHADAVLHFEVTNTGRTTAHNVYCDLQLEEPHLVALLHGEPSHYQIGIGDMSPTQEVPYPLSLDARVHSDGLARVRYRCWCDEVPSIEGDIEFEVPPKEPGGRRIFGF
jgi:hypothetical protein